MTKRAEKLKFQDESLDNKRSLSSSNSTSILYIHSGASTPAFQQQKSIEINDCNLNENNFNDISTKSKEIFSHKTRPVYITSKISFLKIGQIDTRNEKFEAEVFIESSWYDDKLLEHAYDFKLQKEELKNKLAKLDLKYDSKTCWCPELYIDNAVGEPKQEVLYSLRLIEKTGLNEKYVRNHLSNNCYELTVKVLETRRVKGVFYERMEVNTFPLDIQELSVYLTSKKEHKEVRIIENRHDQCVINTDDFSDQQEWELFDYVLSKSMFLEDPNKNFQKSSLKLTGYILRRSGYYIYNAFLLIFLVTILGFVPFTFDTSNPQQRLQITGLLVLTSVNFKWNVTQRLPIVSYLTSLDKYALGNLLFLVLLCVWHSLIGCSIISTDKTLKKDYDTNVLIVFVVCMLSMNIAFTMWFFYTVYNARKFKIVMYEKSIVKMKRKRTQSNGQTNDLIYDTDRLHKDANEDTNADHNADDEDDDVAFKLREDQTMDNRIIIA